MDGSDADSSSPDALPGSADAAPGAEAAALAAAQNPAASAAASQAANASAAAEGSGADDAQSVPPLGGPAAAGAAGAAKASTAALAVARAAASAVSAEKASAAAVGDDKHSLGAPDLASAGPDGNTAAAGMLQLNSNAPSGTAASLPAPTFHVPAAVDSSEFAQGLSDRVSWMVGNGLNGAKLQVNPPSLGPIELRISVSGDHAQVSMSAHSTVTRDALESSSPKLREMLGAQGFSQVSVDISQRSFQDRSAHPQPYEQASSNAQKGAAAAGAVAASTSPSRRTSLAVVDAYA